MAKNNKPITNQRHNQPSTQHQKPVGLVQRSVQHKTIFDPEVIEHYSRLIPDAPERILKVFELNAETERKLQEDCLRHQAADNRRKDWMAFGIIIFGLSLSGFLAYIGATYLSIGALVTIIGYAVMGFLRTKP